MTPIPKHLSNEEMKQLADLIEHPGYEVLLRVIESKRLAALAAMGASIEKNAQEIQDGSGKLPNGATDAIKTLSSITLLLEQLGLVQKEVADKVGSKSVIETVEAITN